MSDKNSLTDIEKETIITQAIDIDENLVDIAKSMIEPRILELFRNFVGKQNNQGGNKNTC